MSRTWSSGSVRAARPLPSKSNGKSRYSAMLQISLKRADGGNVPIESKSAVFYLYREGRGIIFQVVDYARGNRHKHHPHVICLSAARQRLRDAVGVSHSCISQLYLMGHVVHGGEVSERSAVKLIS